MGATAEILGTNLLQAADIEIQAKEILFIRALLCEYIADYTGQPVEKIEDDCDRDFFMTPEEAKDYGIIDEVLASKIRVPTPARPVRRQAPTLPTPRHPTVRPYHTHPRCLSPAPGTVRKLRSRSKLGRGASTPPDATRATIAARASMNNDARRVCLYLKRRAVWPPALYFNSFS